MVGLGWTAQSRAGRARQGRAEQAKADEVVRLATDRQVSERHNDGCSECYTQGLGSTETGHSSSSGRLLSTSQASHLHTVTNGNITLTTLSPMPQKLLNPSPNTQSTDKLYSKQKTADVQSPRNKASSSSIPLLGFHVVHTEAWISNMRSLEEPRLPWAKQKYSATTITNMVHLDLLSETVASTEIYPNDQFDILKHHRHNFNLNKHSVMH